MTDKLVERVSNIVIDTMDNECLFGIKQVDILNQICPPKTTERAVRSTIQKTISEGLFCRKVRYLIYDHGKLAIPIMEELTMRFPAWITAGIEIDQVEELIANGTYAMVTGTERRAKGYLFGGINRKGGHVFCVKYLEACCKAEAGHHLGQRLILDRLNIGRAISQQEYVKLARITPQLTQERRQQ
jgi:hypothetical protein